MLKNGKIYAILSLSGALGEPIISAESKSIHSHSRDCEAITDNLSRIITSVIPDLIGYLSRIKKEAAEIFGSKLSFCPKMTLPVFALALILTFGAIGESWADEDSYTYEYNAYGDEIASYYNGEKESEYSYAYSLLST